MGYYLYIPFSEAETPVRLKNSISEWLESERERNIEVSVSYYGDQKLETIPARTKIYVLMHGILTDSNAQPRVYNTNNLSLTDLPRSILISQIAHNMVSDGLFFNKHDIQLRIKLYFFNVGYKAEDAAKAFTNTLKRYAAYREGDIRIDYYNASRLHPPRPINQHKSLTRQEFPNDHGIRVSSVRQSIFNHVNRLPKLSIDELNLVIEKYYHYKSSRCFGLSGLLGLNGLFSSEDSARAIITLGSNNLSDAARYRIAKQYVDRHPDYHFARYLNNSLNTLQSEEDLFWKSNNLSPESTSTTHFY